MELSQDSHAHRWGFGRCILVPGVCVAQDFSQVLMVACVSVHPQSVYLSAFSLSLTSAFPHSAACGAGTYEMDGTCLPCPANSNSTQPRLSVCPCFEGYYRAAGEPPEMECARKSCARIAVPKISSCYMK